MGTQSFFIRARDAGKISDFFQRNYKVEVKAEPVVAELRVHEDCMGVSVPDSRDFPLGELEKHIGCPIRKCIYGALAVIRKDGKILLLEQPAHKPFAGHWYPPGGSPEGEETVRQAAERETLEEFGIVAKAKEILKVIPSDYKSLYSVFIGCEFVSYLGKDIIPQEGEVQKYGWFSVDEALNDIKLMSATKELFLSLSEGYGPTKKD
jgi:8-oxo-dGTP pyrophosphatase MutT (NUDIX family)